MTAKAYLFINLKNILIKNIGTPNVIKTTPACITEIAGSFTASTSAQ
jgi:hypothetical protein